MLWKRLVLCAAVVSTMFVVSHSADAIVSQADGTIMPVTNHTQLCLDKSSTPSATNLAPGEGPGIIVPIRDAKIVPQTFLPAGADGGGHRYVSFTDVGEGAGYNNRFGWYHVGDSPFDPTKRHQIFDCRNSGANCDCPCNAAPAYGPRTFNPPIPPGAAAACVTVTNFDIVTWDFACLAGATIPAADKWDGRPIAFYMITPERLDGTGNSTYGGFTCADPNTVINRLYSTDNTINDDGDYVHFLIYTSTTFTNAYYFGWEDLFRGGDNDGEDLLTRVTGLVATCNPQPEICDNKDNDCNGIIDDNVTRPCYDGTAGTQGVGPCVAGTQTCAAGVWGTTCAGEVIDHPETCNAIDDNCNGQVDEGLSQACTDTTFPVGTICRTGTWYCNSGVYGPTCVTTPPQSEICDGIDNNCNGQTDENLGSTTCGTGVCRRTVLNCVGGVPQTCMPGPVGVETCNGLDDDCNGAIDDGLSRGCAAAGYPAGTFCAAGTQICTAGAWGTCTGPAPLTEVCNNFDDDCDGVKDNGLGSTTCGVGICQRTQANCVGGIVQTCTPGAAGTETCNGLDDNCNGAIDEGVTQNCTTAFPSTSPCYHGVQTCSAGAFGACVAPLPTPEVCDGIDNNCNGTVDDGLGSTTCGQGICQRTQANCVGGTIRACTPGAPAATETCNGQDDNCNGAVDEGLTQGCVVAGYPAGTLCAAGFQTCSAGTWGTCAGPLPQNEVCNNIDDNCNGVVDDGLGSSTCGVGACQRTVKNCVSGLVQNCVPGAPSAEVCDGIDNNCNGVVDEGLTNSCVVADAGAGTPCASGTQACVGGTWGSCVGPSATDEVCDGVDNNCNGAVDEGLGNSTCGVGACQRTVPNCLAGKPNACVPGTGVPETCNNIDDDCNGIVDEITRACTNTCGAGIQTCVAGSWGACIGRPPSTEVCNGIDDDCNGLVDDGLGNITCGIGACLVTVPACTAGLPTTCVPGTPSAEICNGIDDDCNGLVDDGVTRACTNTCGAGIQVCIAGKPGDAGAPDAGDAGADAGDGGAALWGPCLGGSPSTEVCNGIDDDCNGIIDDGLGTISCGIGACRVTVPACTAGSPTTCTPGAPSPEICDNIDNNCNGAIDDGVTRTCSGACGAGIEVCTAGVWGACLGRSPSTEVCNNIDDDCNGLVDDGLGDISCGIGACRVTVPACVGGVVQTCTPGPTSAEICDNIDNNCNGAVDEGLTKACSDACGPGTQLCTAGSWGPCIGRSSSPEVCDNVDNDCNGVVDDGLGSTTCGVGACQRTVQNCVGGMVQKCVPGTPVAETCNDIDDNCNGLVDENLTRPCSNQCGAGLETCAAGLWGLCDVKVTSEVCDGADNNCNQFIDEGLGVYQDCTLATQCTSGTCDHGRCTCGTAIDCNQGYTCSSGLCRPTCWMGLGVCMRTGVKKCGAGQCCADDGQAACTALVPGPAGVEVCNGLDDDCNGVTDGMVKACYDGPTGTQDVGVCHGGSAACVATVGQADVWGPCLGEVVPTAEVCDGKDNDCNHLIDDNVSDGLGHKTGDSCCPQGIPCGVGECKAGAYACVGSVVQCAGAVLPTDEICDGLDNDCNGKIDDLAGVGDKCLKDSCAGLLGCNLTSHQLECQTASTTGPEICNGIDDDCDGLIDEEPDVSQNDSRLGVACEAPPPPNNLPPCKAGKMTCVDGAPACRGAVQPTAEVCDGIDNNCDGQVDVTADCPDPTYLCRYGMCVPACGGSEWGCPGGYACNQGYCQPNDCRGIVCPGGQPCRMSGGFGYCGDLPLVTPDGGGAGTGGSAGTGGNAGAAGTDTDGSTGGGAGAAGTDTGGSAGTAGGAGIGGSTDVDGSTADGALTGGSAGTTMDGATAGTAGTDGSAAAAGGTYVPTPTVPAGRWGLSTGGGGCSCSTAGGNRPAPMLLALLGLGLLVARRATSRRRPTIAKLLGMCVPAALLAGLLGLALATSGCTTDAFCFSNCVPETQDSGQYDSTTFTGPDGWIQPWDGNAGGGGTGGGPLFDGSAGSAGTGGTGFDGAVTCNDTQSDRLNCGACGNVCSLAGAYAKCVGGVCTIDHCELGRVDLNKDPKDGCEYACLATGNEICDGKDNNCNGVVDEGFDLMTDPLNCGTCGHKCALPNATPACQAAADAGADAGAAACAIASCLDGYWDIDKNPANGCEYACKKTSDTEVCDGLDNNCNGQRDEGFDLTKDPNNCGACGHKCQLPNATATCTNSVCTVASCNQGFANLDTLASNGCEWSCGDVNGVVGPEVCDGRDNNCNGQVDESLTQVCTTICGAGTQSCFMGTWSACVGRIPTAEICNGIDDDCNGLIDDGLGQLSCGQGACARTVQTCVGGAPQTCTPGTPGTETCNNIDDNCNGSVDENVTQPCTNAAYPANTACRTGVQTCVTGVWSACLGPMPSVEICNGIDDNCDGRIDENLGQTTCGVGACQRTVQNCVNGVVQTCTAGAPAKEICNNIDDDCNGQIDEGLTTTCDSGCGPGTATCIAGTWADCIGQPPTSETCNGKDDNCNGLIDEGLGNLTCGRGACVRTVPACVGGVTQTCVPGTPGIETCNGIDDNCNGQVDEGVTQACTTACGPGSRQCVNGTFVGSDCVGTRQPTSEICNGIDDNCNGQIDEGLGSISCGRGACLRTVPACVGGVVQTCTPGAGTTETCNGIDDNCNGQIDEGLTQACTNSCGDGIQTCVVGAWTTCISRQPTSEICNNIDDNCNGQVDEGLGNISCGRGACLRTVPACVGGVVQTCTAGTGTAETCNNIDDNCNGQVDENVTQPCTNTAYPAGTACRTGTQYCAAGTFGPCITPTPTAEVCNNLDDDCNGIPDDNLGSTTCGVGACQRTQANCVGGVVRTCVPGTPGIETCNNIDDDCDGVVDNGVTQACTTSYPSGTVCHTGVATCVGGSWGTCVAPLPQAETCNGLDDDCDGVPDDNLGSTTCGQGACQRTQANCVLGIVRTCVPGTPVPETCNNIDDNCNGQIDEGLTQACATTYAVGTPCHNGTQACIGGTWGTCVGAFPTAETCNGIDDDCNGTADDGLGSTTCGTGPCQRTQQNCVGGVVRTCVPGTPVAETCNNIDDNCDGIIDNGVTRACTGACGAGTQTCITGTWANCVTARSPTAETCNGIDDNCNGQVDEGLGTTWCGVGACRTSQQNCVGGTTRTCTPLAPGVETCNGIDDNCNGQVDEMPMAGFGGPCGTCHRGTLACQGGVSVCVGDVSPVAEICNGIDDDCNNVVDNPTPPATDLPGTGAAFVCGNNVGRCTFGHMACVGGAVICQGGTQPIAELCNGIDDNCNGTTDEGMTTAPAGFVCNQRSLPTDVGVCTSATKYCGGVASWQCRYPASYRNRLHEAYCDGLDNNCDGTTDEGCLSAFPAAGDVRVDQGAAANSIQPMITGNTNAAGALTTLGVVYLDRRNGNADIFFNRATAGGVTWDTDFRIDNAGAGVNSIQPWLSGAGLNNPAITDFFAAWSDFRDAATRRALYSNYSTNDGAGHVFQNADVRIEQATRTVNRDSFNSRVVANGVLVTAVWEELFVDRTRHVFASYSANNGRNWTTPVQVDHNAAANAVASTPAIARGSGTNIFVVWRDNRNGANDIYFNRSTDSGQSWQAADTRMDTDAAGLSASESPSVAADAANNVYVVWSDFRTASHSDIYSRRSTNAGVAWNAADVRVETDLFPHNSATPVALAMPSGAAVCVWLDDRLGRTSVRASRSTDAGATWLASDVPVMAGLPGGGPGSSTASMLTAAASVGAMYAEGTVFVGWADNRNGSLDIFANYSLDGGLSYQPADIRLDSAAGATDSEMPFVYSVGGAGHYVWVDRRADGINGDIYYRSLR